MIVETTIFRSSRPSLDCNATQTEKNFGRHKPVQRHCRCMRANVRPPDQADVTDLQPFNVDAYAKIESERLQFQRAGST